MSLVVVEGCDGSGKSTFVSDINRYLPDDTVTLHRGPLRRDALIEYVHDLVAYDPKNGPSITCDRWHIGEMVYGPLYRAESRMSAAMHLFVENFLDSRGALKVWMDTPFEIVRMRLRERGEDFLLEQHQRLVVDWYREALTEDPKWMRFHWKEKHSRIEELANGASLLAIEAAGMLTEFPSYVGPLRNAQVLIMGSQPPNPSVNWPFTLVPWRGSPMHNVLSAMDLLNFTRIGMLSGTYRGYVLWQRLGEPQIYTLGREATTYCMNNDMPFISLNIPQHGVPIHELCRHLQERK